MILTGSCHCGALSYELDWPGEPGSIPARRCGCTYCMRFGGTWTSHPDAGLTIRGGREALPGAYRFGTGTADFMFCAVCGVTVAAVCESEGVLRAVVNVNTFGDPLPVLEPSDSDFDAESLDQRLQRRTARWIGKVVLA